MMPSSEVIHPPIPTVEVTHDVKRVTIEGLVMLKLVNHCQNSLPQMATGQLLGLDVAESLEVTNCFPFIHREAEFRDGQEEEAEREARDYQYEMLKSLREVNVDCNAVGWYCSIWQEGYLSTNVIETQYDYQKELGANAVCLVFDPLKTTQGKLCIKALRLKKKFMDMYKAGDFTQEAIKENKLTYEDIFEELPLQIKNNSLTDVFISELAGSKYFNDHSCLEDSPELETTGYISYGLEGVVEGCDDLQQTTQKYLYDHRKWKQSQSYHEAGQKPVTKPSRLESILLSKQMMNHCTYLEELGTANFQNLYFADALQKVATDGSRDSS
uniref:MPN domain-containing protein n=1 Tax=Eutreptiella gymnastica TaxID=73025 RepID=A0A7S1I9R5_9EUGL|mmetsp:Transcript_140765/g.245204  ORF Transcript_140765/g.245204 Transcript_140765/m.245204 type:complete len:327 (+) Transcript_140765:51-1031(+)